jgi:hypothetical protein
MPYRGGLSRGSRIGRGRVDLPAGWVGGGTGVLYCSRGGGAGSSNTSVGNCTTGRPMVVVIVVVIVGVGVGVSVMVRVGVTVISNVSVMIAVGVGVSGISQLSVL